MRAVLLSPSPIPSLLWPLAVTLLRAGYIVLIAVTRSEEADQLERRLNLDEKSALRVLIYDPENVSPSHVSKLTFPVRYIPAFPPFARSYLDPSLP